MRVEPVEIDVDPRIGAARVPLDGGLDLTTAEAMLAPAYEFIAGGHRHLVLNCADLAFCDSAGLKAMVTLRDAVEPDGSVTLAGPSTMLVTVLTLTARVDRFAILAPDRATAAHPTASGGRDGRGRCRAHE